MEIVKKVRALLTPEFIIAGIIVSTLGAVFVVPLAIKGYNAIWAKLKGNGGDQAAG